MTSNSQIAYIVLGIYTGCILLAGMLGAFFNWRSLKKNGAGASGGSSLVREHFMAGLGLGFVAWFFSMAASLFSGYSVTGIVNEAYTTGWSATRWIPGGVGVYVGFMVLAPRCFALGKERGYMTVSELLFERYLPPRGRKEVAHAVRLLSFAFLQLPVFTYLITQFRSVGIETETFTKGGIDSLTAVLVSAAVLLICDLMGGMRAVAFTDVLQGIVLLAGSIIFLVIQGTELGGLPAAFDFWSNPANLKASPNVPAMQLLPSKVTTVNYFDFVFKTTVAATMYPHLVMRLFCARSAPIMRRGLAAMNFTFFIVQLSSMVMGWVAINALLGIIKPQQSAFAITLLTVAERGTGQAVISALLLASGICAMMSTADSALLAFSTMWVRDVFKPYLWRNASERVQLLFGKLMAIIGLVIGVTLSLYAIKKGKPDLNGLYAIQAVTPIHVAPAMWLGLHWRGLRGESVLIGMVSGAAVTLGLLFSDKNVMYSKGSDMLKDGLSSAWVGFCVNIFVTVTCGLAQQHLLPQLRARTARAAARPPVVSAADGSVATAKDGYEAAAAKTGSDSSEGDEEVDPRSLDIGPEHDTLCPWWMLVLMTLLLLFTAPFCWPGVADKPTRINQWVGNMSAWAFTSLLISGVTAIVAAAAYLFMWTDYKPLPRNDLPTACSSDLPTLDDKVLNKLQDSKPADNATAAN